MVYSLFDAVGIEIEYMIVDGTSLAVLPLAEKLLTMPDGRIENEIEKGMINWSNELVAHVIELKLAEPSSGFFDFVRLFQGQVDEINKRLNDYGAMLLPGGMHPFMNPAKDTVLWPYGDKAIYNAYDRIFGCKGHGWSNLQSVHINLPFNGDQEFALLHSAIRLVLPLVPAICASSPIMEGRLTGFLDNRLEVYRFNQKKIPSIAGEIIPEAVFSEEEYRDRILSPMYLDTDPYDPDGILRDEWLNSRGAIARFDRNAIEIRLIDTQECPGADIAISAFVFYLVKAVCEEKFASFSAYKDFETKRLAAILIKCIADGGNALVDDVGYMTLFGMKGENMRARDVIKHLYGALITDCSGLDAFKENLGVIVESGSLASRIVSAIAKDHGYSRMINIWRILASCLGEGKMFNPSVK